MRKIALFSLALTLAAGARAAELNGFRAADIKNLTAQIPAPSAALLPLEEISRADTSGCSVQAQRRQSGPLVIAATAVPSRSCWNLPGGGLTAEYKWRQSDKVPQKISIGFWLSLNGAAQYRKASSYKCELDPQLNYSPDTSGSGSYTCTAYSSFAFGDNPGLLTFAYAPSGSRNAWDVQAAVSLDDNGGWDSLNGGNYRFRF